MFAPSQGWMFSSVSRLPFHSSNERVIGEKKCSQQTMEGFQTSLLLVFSSQGPSVRPAQRTKMWLCRETKARPTWRPRTNHIPSLAVHPGILCLPCRGGGERVSGQRDREHLSAGGELDKELPVSCGKCVPALSPHHSELTWTVKRVAFIGFLEKTFFEIPLELNVFLFFCCCCWSFCFLSFPPSLRLPVETSRQGKITWVSENASLETSALKSPFYVYHTWQPKLNWTNNLLAVRRWHEPLQRCVVHCVAVHTLNIMYWFKKKNCHGTENSTIKYIYIKYSHSIQITANHLY